MSPLAAGAASLWLGVLLATAAVAVVRLWPGLGATGRYRLWYAILVATVVLPVTLALLPDRATMGAPPAELSTSAPAGIAPRPADPASGSGELAAPATTEDATTGWGWRLTVPHQATGLVLWVWLAGAIVMLGRLGVEAVRLARLRHQAHPPSRELLALWSAAVGTVPTGRRLRLLVSDRVPVPMACGWLRPAVLMPAALPGHLPPDEVRHLLLHELAHLARWDDWHALLQHLMRAVGWWHPVVRWVTDRLETERELACDAVVVAHADRRGYARTLVHVAEAAQHHDGVLAPTAARGRLSDRIEVLLGRTTASRGWRRLGSGMLLGGLALSVAWIGPPALAVSRVSAEAIGPRRSDRIDPTLVRAGVGRALDSVFRGYADSGFAGTVLVALGDQVVLEQGYGFADRERGIPASAETRYSVAGITKLFTAAAVMVLEEEGKLATSDRLSRWVGPLPGDKDAVTLHHLLTHTDGLTRQSAPVYRRSADGFVTAVGRTPAAFAPGAGYRYNDFGHSLLGLVVERASGQSYEDFIRHRFIKKVGLKQTGFEPEASEMAVEYAGPGADQPLGLRAYTWGRRGSLGLVSTAGDLYRWYRAMRHSPLLPKGVWERMTTAQARSDWGAEQGYGWDLQPRPDGRTLLRRVAGTPGFEGEILHDPEGQWTAVILVNSRVGWRFKVWQAIERAVRSSGPIR